MAPTKLGCTVWLSLLTLLWAGQPLLFSQARGILLFALFTAMLTLLGWIGTWPVLLFCSGILGLANVTLALAISAQPPNLWVGLGIGLTLLALLDGSHRYAYLRHCRIQAGVLTAMLETFVRLSGLSLAVGLGLGMLLIVIGTSLTAGSRAGVLTIAGAACFAGCFALFLLYTHYTSDS